MICAIVCSPHTQYTFIYKIYTMKIEKIVPSTKIEFYEIFASNNTFRLY